MASPRSRKRLEKKIVTSVLSVGVVPLLVVLALGFVSVKAVISRSVRQELENTALNLADAVDSGLKTRVILAESLAVSPNVRAALSPSVAEESAGSAESALSALSVHFESLKELYSQDITEISLVDPAGKTLVSSGGRASADLTDAPWWDNLPTEEKWFITEIKPDRVERTFHAQILAPVRSADTQTVLGYVSFIVDVGGVMEMLRSSGTTDRIDQPLIARMTESSQRAVNLGQPGQRPETYQLDSHVVDALEQSKHGAVRSRWTDGTRYFVGYAHMSLPTLSGSPQAARRQMFVMVRRPEHVVFSGIYRVSLSAVLGSGLLLTLFCLLEVRRIHNNIVRPVSLLNEGAQIIGQGDLELKLKINTNDEIEELAASFNRMALDLKGNIHQLEESERKYRELVTSMKEGIYQTDLAGVVTYANPSAAEIFGYSETAEFIDTQFDTFFIDEADVAWFKSSLLSDGYVAGYRCWMRRQDGENICVELSASQLRGQAGRVLGSEGIVRDVTQRVELERESREKADRIAVINEITKAVNSSLDVDRVLETVAVEVRKLVEFDAATLMLLTDGRRVLEHYRLWPKYERARDLHLESGNPIEWVLTHGQPLLIPGPQGGQPQQTDGEMASQVVLPLVLQDNVVGTFELGSRRPQAFTQYHLEVLEQVAAQVTVAVQNARLYADLEHSFEDVKRAREELARANAELTSLDTMKTNLLSNVSHELRTPLVSIMGYTDMIFNEKVGRITPTQKEYLSISLRNIDRLVTLIENLLDFSRLHRRTEALVFETFNLVEVARSSVEMLQPTAATRNIAIEVDTAETQFEVDGDKGKMGQVFSNLLSNAVKFNVDGGHVSVRLARSGTDAVEVSVRDTGIGIDTDALDKVFTRFYQIDSSSTRKYGGTGIGLSIAQDIVRLHGGRITVSSKPGEGATFRFTLPLSRADEPADSTDTSPLPQPHIIEVVTTNDDLRATIKTYCDREEISLISAASPADAMALAKRHRPDCILVDADTIDDVMTTVVLPLRKGTPKNTSVILISSDTKPLYDDQAEHIAARLRQSFSRTTFMRSVKYAMDPRRKRRAPSGRNVLIVDDDPEVIDFVTRCLGAEGYVVNGVTSGSNVAGLLRSGDYGLVLLDIAMPGLDGWSVCRSIKDTPDSSRPHVYMVTARPEAEIEAKIRQCGADGYLLKPFRAEDLLMCVTQVLPHPAKTHAESQQ